MFISAIALLSWLVLSPIVVVWWYFNLCNVEKFAARHESIVTAVCVGAFIGVAAVLRLGFEKLLVWLPANMQDGTASLLALFVTLFVAHILLQAVTTRNASEKLNKSEDALATAKRAASSAEQNAEMLERQIKKILRNLANFGLLEAYERAESEREAKLEDQQPRMYEFWSSRDNSTLAEFETELVSGIAGNFPLR